MSLNGGGGRLPFVRLNERQTRIIQALDNTYNTLQEALGGNAITRKPTPGAISPFPP